MVGFSEVCQFEIDRKRLRHLMRISEIQTTDNFLRTFEQTLHRVHFSMFDQQQSQLFDC